MSEQVELLFFDTFAHDNTEELNLDLVQFPKPVFITEVRIIPLGARVQADFPGGVRLGATNPSQFQIEFFVNDLGKPGASTFETLGGFQYDQNCCINLECCSDETLRKIPTDGLVLRGWYTTITLAVYGTLTNNIAEQIIQPVVTPSIPSQANTIADVQQISSVEQEWPQEPVVAQIDYTTQQPASYQTYTQNEPYSEEYVEFYNNDAPKDPRSYHHTPETDWDAKSRTREERERDRSRDLPYQKSTSTDHPDRDRRDRECRLSRSGSRDRDRPREYREISRDREKDHDRDWDRERERDRDRDNRDWDRERDYRQDRDHDWSESDRERHERERRERRHEEHRRYREERDREERKRPRTPPVVQSPKRPHTPELDLKKENPSEKTEPQPESKIQEPEKEAKDTRSPPAEETTLMDVEEFEPILSDEDILDDTEHYQDLDYDYTAYTNNDDIVKLFTPGVTELKMYPSPPKFRITEHGIVIVESLKTIIGIADDYLKSSITKYVIETFPRHNTEIKEEFIHLCEKLGGIVGPPETFCEIVNLYKHVVAIQPKSDEDKELITQIQFIIDTIHDWLKIALSYEMANIQDQPAYKIRHIKCGVRLAEWVNSSEDFIKLLWNRKFYIHKELLNLYEQEFMALSIKLMILKALDTFLQHKFAIEKFLMGENDDYPKENGYFDVIPVSEVNGYKFLVLSMKKNPLVRLKFALSSILRKLNLYEVLHKVHSILIKLKSSTQDVSAEEINLITKSLNQILNYCHAGPFTLSQPKRFLPVSAQFEINQSETKNVVIEYFKMFNLLQCFLLLLTHPSTMNLPAIKTPIFEIIETLMENSDGLKYLAMNISSVNILLKCVLRTDEELQYSLQNDIGVYSHNLGLTVAYKLQSLYHVEALFDIAKRYNYDPDASDILDQLHGLFCLSFTGVGKLASAKVLGLDDNIKAVLQFFENINMKEKSEGYISKLNKSPGIAYAIDLIHVAVVTIPNINLLEKYSRTILSLTHMLYDESMVAKLNELQSFLSPLENVPSLNYDNISHFVGTIEKNINNVISNPGPVITSLRIIEHFGIGPQNKKSLALLDNPFYNYNELKYKHVVLQLFSLDGTAILAKLLQKICSYFEQPHLHTSVFVSNQGLHVVNIIRPAVFLLKQMLAYVIQCQNTNFKDLTTIPVFLQTYNLVNSYPNSAVGYSIAQEIKSCIIEALLVYTQPMSDEVHEKDSLTKTLWTQMCGEVIKYTTTAPHTFVSGLLILSELLPLPLPIQSRDELTQDEISWSINLRKLWSAHLHPHSTNIQDMVNKLCVSTQPQLLNLLRRICVQIADLAANSALMIARGILDKVYDTMVPKEGANVEPCNSHVSRLLNFLACLVTHSTIKCAVLHLIHTNSNVTQKTDEKYGTLIPTFVQVLKNNNNSNSHIQSQECILSIIQSFCDTEITLLQKNIPDNQEAALLTNLANAMPIKEHLLVFIDIMLDHLSAENSFVTYLPIIRTLLLLTEHDYGFYHLRENMLKRNQLFKVLLEKLVENFSKTNTEYLSTLNTLMEFLRVSLTPEECDGLSVPRKMSLSLEEVKMLIDWNVSETEEDKEKKHSLEVLESLLKKATEEDNNFESMLEAVTVILKLLNENESIKKENFSEIILSAPEPLLTQFSLRTVFSSTDACDERLTSRFWLALPNDEGGEADPDNMTCCDILEVCKQNLSQDFNVVKEVEKLCKISRIDNTDEKEKNPVDEKDKKPFVTPTRTRGFPRTVQQRTDLFRSRPPNTSRPPSLHVDDFVALETCGAQPTGPTGYNKISRELLASTRVARGTRGRAFIASERSLHYRQMAWWGAAFSRSPYQF